MFLRLLATFLFATFLLATTGAAAESAPRFRIVDFGVYATNTTERQLAPGSTSGDIGVAEATEFFVPLRQTTVIDAAIGVEFGFNFVDDALPSFDSAPVQIRVEHPPIVAIDGKPVRVDSWEASVQGIPRFTGWKFERPEELVPGTWTIAVVQNDSVVLKQAFDVRVAR